MTADRAKMTFKTGKATPADQRREKTHAPVEAGACFFCGRAG